VNDATIHIPGKIMLTGEYAALRGGQVVACTVDAFMTITMRQRRDGKVRVQSDLNDETKEYPASLLPELRFEDPVLDTLAVGLQHFPVSGCDVTIDANLNPSFGIGSSSALRLGILQGLACLTPATDKNATDVARIGWQLQRDAQPDASGYDLMTQMAGGLMLFENLRDPQWPGPLQRLSGYETTIRRLIHPLIGGKGAPTAQVMRDTLAWIEAAALWPTIVEKSNHLTAVLLDYCKNPESQNQMRQVIKAAAALREVFAEAPHFPRALAAHLREIPGFDERWTFKTTGAGGEDALLLIGSSVDCSRALEKLQTLGWKNLPFDFSAHGLSVGPVN